MKRGVGGNKRDAETSTIFPKKNRRSSGTIFLNKNRRGQVTIFIIIGVIIVAIAVLIYSFYPQIKSALGGEEKNPQSYIQTCLEDEINKVVEKISLSGGDLNPTFFSTFDGIKIKNLCYTSLYCTLCSVQEPQLNPHIEEEIKNNIEDKADKCFDSLKTSYEKRGFDVNLKKEDIDVKILPKKITTTLNYTVTITKSDTQRYDNFVIALNNNLYELLAIANNIVELEANYGNSDVTIYMDLYPHLKVEKRLLSDGTKIYIASDRATENKFEFASRSLVYSPSGYC